MRVPGIDVLGNAAAQFDVEADYDLIQFADAVEHLERANRNGAILLSSDW